MTTNPIRVGLVGLGRAGNGMHRGELRGRQDKFRFAAVCDVIGERTEGRTSLSRSRFPCVCAKSKS